MNGGDAGATPVAAALGPFPAEADDARLPQRVHAVLRRAIRELRLRPGQTVLEREVVEALGASRTPVREALVRLEAEQLVRLIPRRGFAVAPLAAADMRQLYEIVEGLESVAVELAAERATAADLAALDAAIRDQETALAAGDLLGWIEADERFHRGILTAAGNARLAQLVERYTDHLHRARLYTIRHRPPPLRSTAEHRAAVEAIRTGNGRAARELHHAHRRRAREEIVGILSALEATRPPPRRRRARTT